MNLKTVDGFSHFLSRHSGSSLVFSVDGNRILPGYHVTEIKFARIQSIDCGRGIDEWNEVVIQLLDGSQTSKDGHMSVLKFLGIFTAASESLAQCETAQLFFEFSPDNGPIMKLSVDSVEHADERVLVSLTGPVAVCKPFQRSKYTGVETAAASCENSLPISANNQACCEAGGKSASCCE